MLTLEHLSVTIDEKPIVSDISLTFSPGKIYCLLGHNGSGKSSLAFALMGHPRYQASGFLTKDGKDILSMSVNERALAGMFLSFQNIPEIPGVRVLEYLRTIYNIRLKQKDPSSKGISSFLFRRYIAPMREALGVDEKFLDRDLYVGFSGGEKRKLELLQIRLLDPDCILLDEIDSGLDIGAVKLLSEEIIRLRKEEKTVIMITHNFHLLDTIEPDAVIVMSAGKILRE